MSATANVSRINLSETFNSERVEIALNENGYDDAGMTVYSVECHERHGSSAVDAGSYEAGVERVLREIASRHGLEIIGAIELA